MDDGAPRIGCVVPVRDEVDAIVELYERFDAAMHANGWDYELVFVDDASTDATWQVVSQLAERDPRVGGLRLARPAGLMEAIAVGLGATTGDVIATMDGDLEARPEDMPPIIASALGGIEFSSGARLHGERPAARRIASAALRTIMWFAPHRPEDFGCGMKAFAPALVDRVLADPDAGTGLGFAFSLLRATRSYEDHPVPWDHRGQPSHFTTRQLAHNLLAFTAMTFGPHLRTVRTAAIATFAATAIRQARAGRWVRVTTTAGAGAATLAAVAELERRGRSGGRPGSTVLIGEQVGVVADRG